MQPRPKALLLILASTIAFKGALGFASLPPDAQKMLDSFPGKKVSLELVLGRAMQHSDSFKALVSAKIAVDVPYLLSRAPFDLQFTGSGSRTVNRNEPQSPFSPFLTINNSVGAGLASQFSTGTSLGFNLSHGYTDLSFNGFPFSPFLETKASLELRQDLLKNFFGYGARRAQEAGDLSKSAAEEALQDSIESWALGLVQIYYGAWLAQAQAVAAQETVERRKRLVSITELKLRRGTAETPDLLQVKGAWMAAQLQQGQAQQVLGDRWRGLVLALKLPEDWLGLDPLAIPLELDSPAEEALKVCGQDATRTYPASTAATRQANKTAEAARLTAERQANANLPSLQLVGQLATNSIDGADLGLTFGETFTGRYPAWTLGLSLSIPLLRYSERAQASTAIAEAIRADAASSEAAANLKLDWLNGCTDLARLSEAQRLLNQTQSDQIERARAEEKRFGLGRSQTYQVIQAQDEAASAALQTRSSQVEYRVAAWRIHRIHGRVTSFLEELRSRWEKAAP